VARSARQGLFACVSGRWVVGAALVLAALHAQGRAWGRGEAPLARVIGGGPAAFAAAIVLRGAGWEVEQSFPALPPRGHLAVVGLNAARWLQAHGSGDVLHAVTERGVLDGGELRRAPLYMSSTGAQPRFPWNWIGRSTQLAPVGAIEGALRQRAEALGARLLPGTTVLDVMAVEGGSHLRCAEASGREQPTTGLPARLVVDASGLGSILRWNGVLPQRRVATRDQALSSWMSLAPLGASVPAPPRGVALPELLLLRVADPAAPSAVVVGGVQRCRDGRGQLSLEHGDRGAQPTPAQRDALLSQVVAQLSLDPTTLLLDSAATFRAGLSRIDRYWNGDPVAPIVCLGDRAIEPHLRMGSGISSALAAVTLLLPLATSLHRQDPSLNPTAAEAALGAYAQQMQGLADALAEMARGFLPDHESWLKSFVPPS